MPEPDYSNPPFSVYVRNQDFSRRFESFSDLEKWAQEQHDQWSEAVQTLDSFKDGLGAAYGEQVSLWTHLVRHANTNNANQIRIWFERDLERGYPIIFEAVFGKLFRELVSLKNIDAACGLFVEAWVGEIPDTKMFESQRNALIERVFFDSNFPTKMYNEFTNTPVGQRLLNEFYSRKAESLKDRIVGMESEVKSGIDSIISSQISDAALENIEKFWESRHADFDIQQKTGQRIIGITILLTFFILLICSRVFSEYLTGGNVSISPIGIIVGAVVLGAFFSLLRLGIRLVNQSVLGKADAKERIAMIKTFVVFEANNMLEKPGDRELILKALFRAGPGMDRDSEPSSSVFEEALKRFNNRD